MGRHHTVQFFIDTRKLRPESKVTREETKKERSGFGSEGTCREVKLLFVGKLSRPTPSSTTLHLETVRKHHLALQFSLR